MCQQIEAMTENQTMFSNKNTTTKRERHRPGGRPSSRRSKQKEVSANLKTGLSLAHLRHKLYPVGSATRFPAPSPGRPCE